MDDVHHIQRDDHNEVDDVDEIRYTLPNKRRDTKRERMEKAIKVRRREEAGLVLGKVLESGMKTTMVGMKML